MTDQKPILTGAEKALLAQLEQAGQSAGAHEFAIAGLPTRRVESYHYSDLRSLLTQVPLLAVAADVAPGTESPAPYLSDAVCLDMVNGRVSIPGNMPAGLVVKEISGSVLSERDDALVRLNRGLAGQAVHIQFEGDVGWTVLVSRHLSGDACHVVDGVDVIVAPGASGTLVEMFDSSDAAHLGNHATRVRLGEGARFTHVIIDLCARAVRHFHSLEYDLGTNASMRNLIVNSGASLSRVQMFGRFSGSRAHGDFTGLNLVDEGQHCDITFDLGHAVPDTTSRELFKSVARNRARAVFQGKIVVDPVAQKTDAKMMAQGLMLSEGAQILTKPELEIFADDVQCGHGCTCGELDSDTLFYLMSRGIPRAEAESMLIRAFLQELFDPLENDELVGRLEAIVANWLENGSASAGAGKAD